jgi:CHAT domain-containing protein/Tfp pilus assembly protein PilF
MASSSVLRPKATVLALLPLLLAGAAGEEIRPLRPGAVVEREIAAGQVHRYELALDAGHFARLVIEQHGIDVALTVAEGGGPFFTKVHSPAGRDSDEVLSLVADQAAVYRLDVSGLPGTAGPGRYTLRLVDWRAAAPADRLRVAAERAEAAADQIYLRSTAAGYREALAAYAGALDLWRQAGDASKEAEILYRLGVTQRRLGDLRAALERLDEALTIERRRGDRPWQATLLNQKGLILSGLGEYAPALAALQEALALRRAQGNPELAVPVLNNIGLIHQHRGDLGEARAAYLQALETVRRTGDRSREASLLGNLGSVHDSLGEPLAALRFLEEQLTLARTLADAELQAIALSNIGLARHKLGEPQAALESDSAALVLFRQIGDRNWEATVLTNLGALALELGEPEAALEPFGQALAIQRATGARGGEALTLTNLGRTESALGKSAEALAAFDRALAIQRETGDRAGETATLLHLGAHLTAQGRPREALDPLRQALGLAQEVGDRSAEARARHGLGAALAAQGDPAAALASLLESLRLRREVSDPAGEVETLQEIARAEIARGRLDEARTRLEAALGLAESLRLRITGDRLRSSYFASLHEIYEMEIDVLMALHAKQPEAGFAALAYEAAERARARGLLDLLREARVEIRRGADPRLLDDERRLRGELRARAERQTLLLQAKHTPEQAAEAGRQVEEALSSYALAESKLHAALPGYAGLVRPAAVSLPEVQQLLDPDTVLLEYALGPQRSFVWAVTPSSFTVRPLPGRDEIETAAGDVSRLFRAPDPGGDPHRRERLARLGTMLLGPVADRLAGKRLAIVAPGALQYVPFAALPLPTGDPVVEHYEVVSLPSAAVLWELRHKAAGRPAATGELAILADPVFQADDPRVTGSAQPAAVAPKPTADLDRLTRDAGGSNIAGFPRLPWTRREAEAAAAQAAGRPVLLSLDFRASLDTVTGPDLARYRRIHFATHGLLDDRHPELSGLVLSLVDAQGRPRDGFLRLADVYNLDLGAELVVLSGCQTALGRQVRGEGLIGLTRGFFYAGASQVVASLWPVRDRATAELMERFYRALFHEGLKPAAALHAAELALRHDPRWRDPYYWAPFVASGDW